MGSVFRMKWTFSSPQLFFSSLFLFFHNFFPSSLHLIEICLVPIPWWLANMAKNKVSSMVTQVSSLTAPAAEILPAPTTADSLPIKYQPVLVRPGANKLALYITRQIPVVNHQGAKLPVAHFILCFLGLEFELNSFTSIFEKCIIGLISGTRLSFEPSWPLTSIRRDKIGLAQFK